MGCKWSSLNAPGIEKPLSHSVLKLYEFPFLIALPTVLIGSTELNFNILTICGTLPKYKFESISFEVTFAVLPFFRPSLARARHNNFATDFPGMNSFQGNY